jgi:hypothetical protein
MHAAAPFQNLVPKHQVPSASLTGHPTAAFSSHHTFYMCNLSLVGPKTAWEDSMDNWDILRRASNTLRLVQIVVLVDISAMVPSAPLSRAL